MLLVDDTASNVKMLRHLLTREGIESDFAENGLIGVEKCFTRPYDIVLMDREMPVMDGIHATREIRQRGFANLIIAVTGNVLDDESDEFLEAGADIVFPKPFRKVFLDALLEYVKKNGPKARTKLTVNPDTGEIIPRS